MNRLRAWTLGIRDGWNQPIVLSTSTNVDHLGDVQESLDRGINLGQLLRAGHRSQAARLGYWDVRP
jgi:hypothetical protein